MRIGAAVVLCSLFLNSSAISFAGGREETALDRYVAAADSNYEYRLLNTVGGEGYTAHVVELTSQQWRTPQEVDRPIWKHWLTIVRPEHVATGTSLLIVSGGSNDKPPPQINPVLTQIASATASVVSEIRMVPNQPLVFTDDGRKRTEDGITVYSWQKFLTTGDETWPIRLPMTKSVVRAMDTITSICASPEGGGTAVDKFVVAGASKRGWTAWTVAAVDGRVVAIIPAVIDLLNLKASFEHHYRAYGFWAPAIAEFERSGITEWANTPRFDELMQIEDPYSYRDRLTIPKYIVNSVGDQYFQPDSSRFYFDALKGENYLRYVPNTDHSLKGWYADAAEGAVAFYQSILINAPRPRFAWNFDGTDAIRVKTEAKPETVKLWQARNPDARDFRLQTIGRAFASSNLEDQGDGVFVGRVPGGSSGWTAYFIELTFPSAGRYPFKFTTAIRVSPDQLPFGPPPQREASPGNRPAGN